MEDIRVWIFLMVSLILIFEKRRLAKQLQKYEWYRWGRKVDRKAYETILMVVGFLGIVGVVVYLIVVSGKYVGSL